MIWQAGGNAGFELERDVKAEDGDTGTSARSGTSHPQACCDVGRSEPA